VNVREGQRVQRGEQLGTVGKPTRGTEHLHFDLGRTEALFLNPADWPGLDWSRLKRDYVNPKTFLMENRPPRT
jgi:murein DD-endopeptidase MepM/ murein hydrolase activator NlpD